MNQIILNSESQELVKKLAEISQLGPLPAVGTGDASIGMTLLSRLGLPYSSTTKPSFKGIVITARRGTKAKDINRVNLFAKVPDWDVSSCKSSRELVDRYGYVRDGERKLYCTVRARQPNRQGLKLEIDRDAGLLREQYVDKNGICIPVASWHLSGLEKKLMKSHQASVWIVAVSSKRGDEEFFHFRYATFTSAPRVTECVPLLEQGTITMDHLIWNRAGRVTEKGPLFKIKPENVESLLPVSARLDLLSL